MKRLLLFLLFPVGFLLFSVGAFAQTTVSGTVVDPNGNAYANGTASAYTVVASGQASTSTTPVATSAAGSFSLSLGAGSYIFTICAPPVLLNVPVTNPTPTQICFSSQAIAVSGSGTLTISAQLNAVAPVLGPSNTGGGGSGTVSNCPTAPCLPYYGAAGAILLSDPNASLDGNGNGKMTSLSLTGTGTGVITMPTGATPVLPAANKDNFFFDTGNNWNCQAPTGSTCGANLARLNKTLMIDGVTYAYTAAGIQAALNAVAAATQDGIGGTVILPAISISLGTTGLTIPGGVTLACESGKDACQLNYTGTGAVITIGSATAGAFHAGLRNVFITLPSAASGAQCILIQGFASGNQAQHNTVEDNTCWFNYPTRNSVAAGTTGIAQTGAQVGTASLNHINRNKIVNAANAVVITNGEQTWIDQTLIDWFTAPAVSLVNSRAIYGSFRIAGNGSTGSAVNIDITSARNHLYAWCDSGSAQCFNEAGNSNYIEGTSPQSGLIPLGTLAANDTSLVIYNGQLRNETRTWSCTIAVNILNTSTGDWCRFTSPVALTVTRIESVSDIAGAGCTTVPQLQFLGSLGPAVTASFTNAANNIDSGILTSNFNAQQFKMNVIGGIGCTSPWQYTTITVSYVMQYSP